MAYSTSRVRRARKVRYGCHVVQPGEIYIEHVEFPGHDCGSATEAGHPVKFVECRDCAERYGRSPMIEAYLNNQGEK